MSCPNSPGLDTNQKTRSQLRIRTYGIPSYAIVQSYTHLTVGFNASKQNCKPRVRGNKTCLRSWIFILLAHFSLIPRVLPDRFVPSGKMSNHIACCRLGFERWLIRCSNRGRSASQRRDRKTQEKNIMPGPRTGMFFRESLRTMNRWP